MQQDALPRQLVTSQLKQRRASLSPHGRAARSLAWCDQAISWFSASKIPQHTIIGLYAPVRDELDISPLSQWLSDQSYSLSLPVIQDAGRELIFRHWQPGDVTVNHAKYKIPQPAETAERVIPDLIFVPLLGFDLLGNRMGYGGGYYDATLAALRQHNPKLQAIGCAYAIQQCEALSTEPHDQPLDAVITDQQVYLFRK